MYHKDTAALSQVSGTENLIDVMHKNFEGEDVLPPKDNVALWVNDAKGGKRGNPLWHQFSLSQAILRALNGTPES